MSICPGFRPVMDGKRVVYMPAGEVSEPTPVMQGWYRTMPVPDQMHCTNCKYEWITLATCRPCLPGCPCAPFHVPVYPVPLPETLASLEEMLA